MSLASHINTHKSESNANLKREGKRKSLWFVSVWVFHNFKNYCLDDWPAGWFYYVQTRKYSKAGANIQVKISGFRRILRMSQFPLRVSRSPERHWRPLSKCPWLDLYFHNCPYVWLSHFSLSQVFGLLNWSPTNKQKVKLRARLYRRERDTTGSALIGFRCDV